MYATSISELTQWSGKNLLLKFEGKQLLLVQFFYQNASFPVVTPIGLAKGDENSYFLVKT